LIYRRRSVSAELDRDAFDFRGIGAIEFYFEPDNISGLLELRNFLGRKE
jgi:hypothetical protein